MGTRGGGGVHVCVWYRLRALAMVSVHFPSLVKWVRRFLVLSVSVVLLTVCTWVFSPIYLGTCAAIPQLPLFWLHTIS